MKREILGDLLDVYKEISLFVNKLETVTGGYPMNLDEITEDIEDKMAKYAEMPRSHTKKYFDFEYKGHEFVFDYWWELTSDYVKGKIDKEKVVNEFINWKAPYVEEG